jgi:hypothetical protein
VKVPGKIRLLVSVVTVSLGCSSQNVPPTGVDPTFHPSFPIDPSSGHAYGAASAEGTIGCDSCHPPTSATFTDFTCTGCHEHDTSTCDQLHATVANYSYDSNQCLSCHPVGVRIPFDHAGITASCASCHDAGTTFAMLPIPNFIHPDMGGADCSQCHKTNANWEGGAPQYIVVGGFTVPSPPAASPTVEPGIASLPHPESAGGVTCSTCHSGLGGPRPARGYDHAAPLATTSCSACHEAGSDLVAAVWNGATSESAGTGDTRPYTLSSVAASFHGDSQNVTYLNHFYPADCAECHLAPVSVGLTQNGAAYSSAWSFPHNTHSMSNPTTCLMCHTSGVPN